MPNMNKAPQREYWAAFRSKRFTHVELIPFMQAMREAENVCMEHLYTKWAHRRRVKQARAKRRTEAHPAPTMPAPYKAGLPDVFGRMI